MIPFLTALASAAALKGTVEISDQSEVRVRSGLGVSGPVIDVETTPGIRIGVDARSWNLGAGYSPHLALLQIGAGAQPTVMHVASLGATLRGRLTSLSCSEDASYGRQSFASLAPDPTLAPASPHPEPIPAAAVVDYASSRTRCAGSLSASRRWSLGASFEYALSGGIDAPSRAVLPFQRGPRGEIHTEVAASREDRVAAGVSAEEAAFSSGEDDAVMSLTTSWRHAFGREVQSQLGAGLGWSSNRESALAVPVTRLNPVAEASIRSVFRPARVEAALSVQLSPLIDRLNGHVYESLAAMATGAWSPVRAVSVEGQLGGTQSVLEGGSGSLAVLLGGIAVSYRMNEIVELRGGARGAATHATGTDAPPALWVTFLGATFRAPPLRL